MAQFRAVLSRQSHPRPERVVIEISGLTTFPDRCESYSQQRVRMEGLDKMVLLAVMAKGVEQQQEGTLSVGLLCATARLLE